MAKLRYVRCGDELDDDTELVVRGGLLDPDVLRADALRMHSVYGIYGISVLSLRGVAIDELAQELPLSRFRQLTQIAVGELRSAGLRIEPTGRNRRHYTLVFTDLGDGVARLCRCAHDVWENPYHAGMPR